MTLLRFSNHEDEGTNMLRNFGKYVANEALEDLRRI
jgi:hypothetical protein